MVWLKLVVFIILSLTLRKIAKNGIAKWKNLQKNVLERLAKEGWLQQTRIDLDGAVLAVYKKGSKKKVVLLDNKSVDFEKVKKGLAISALNNAEQFCVYCNDIKTHAHRALMLASKNRHVHGVEIKLWIG